MLKHPVTTIERTRIRAKCNSLLTKFGVFEPNKFNKAFLSHRKKILSSHPSLRQSTTYKEVYDELKSFYADVNTCQSAVKLFLRDQRSQSLLNHPMTSVNYWSLHKHYCDDT